MGSLDGRRGYPRAAQTSLLTNTANGDTTLFTGDGSIRLIGIVGIVKTTAMAAAQCQLKLKATADALAAVDLCAVLDVTGDAIGTAYNVTGTLGDTLIAATNGVAISQAGYINICCDASWVIELDNADAANAGQTFWQLEYEPYHPGVIVTPS